MFALVDEQRTQRSRRLCSKQQPYPLFRIAPSRPIGILPLSFCLNPIRSTVMFSHRVGCQRIRYNQVLRLALSQISGKTAAVRPPIGSWKRTFSSALSHGSSNISLEIPRTPLERHKFKTQAQLWETYVETGEGVTELFDSFLLDESSSQTIPAAEIQRFLDQIEHKGIGDAEFHELDERKELDVKAFRSWARHATHDWSVHV
uniref:Uncharacterized protein n=1 Tax=Amphora coffeiformis TaxID=265554 RepID=A0A7S3LFN8_9STRA